MSRKKTSSNFAVVSLFVVPKPGERRGKGYGQTNLVPEALTQREREGGREGGRDGGRERGRERGREGGSEGEGEGEARARERARARAREREREREREGGREGGRGGKRGEEGGEGERGRGSFSFSCLPLIRASGTRVG